MFLAALLFSFFFAIVLSSVLIYGFRRSVPGPWNGIPMTFLLIFMFTWAIGSWIEPIGPDYWGVYWLGYLLIAVLVTMLVGLFLPPRPPRNRIISKTEVDEEVRQSETSRAIEITFGFFFWFLIIVLLAVALSRKMM